ncbi:hypothetical protein DEU56DRAFT_439609 [Suillus clintonianus]|uniref:uncharacterized protein n=1 Tax=Suillus clintonianus TaxID=1904413 RepID=UPI001B87EAF0|nr:uncharacterized protein DEU56DRAFT_439609 [Suillus clintonianus]KAG2132765.1 hypothetical protein DEU56DRAFT_439609 [Suillus clintonianus]
MTRMGKEPAKIEAQLTFPPLDESHYSLRPKDAAFYKKLTGIEDDVALKQHILNVQQKAYKVAPYGSILLLSFLRRNLSELPAYQQIVRIGRTRKNPLLLDIGCCFGNVLREAVFDGFPASGAIGSDLHQELWDLGHELFKSSPETFPGHFVGGDAFDPEILAVAPPATAAVPIPDLNNLTSLNPLHGCFSVIHATAFFHLFKEDRQLHLARAFAGLLSAESGSVILGAHVGAQEKGTVNKVFNGVEVDMFAHDPESWIAMWDGEVFQKGTVKVEAELRQETYGAVETDGHPLSLFWSVTRL